jgi:uncharacterized protein YutE (UPF0331/DUF86 family)
LGLDRQVIASRLAALDEHLRLLGPLAALDLEAFTSDPRNYGSAERFLQLAIESVFDIGTHCISALRLARPTTYGDVLPTLAEASVITRETARELTNLAGFRNLLVHDYTRVDRARVHAFLNTRLDGFRRFAADIADFVSRQPPRDV